tara:strand:+ start:64 stop:387 length:324 start_codon:yes stop_codon:yes gene_type:complete
MSGIDHDNSHGNDRVAIYSFPSDDPNVERREEIIEWAYQRGSESKPMLAVFMDFKKTMMAQGHHVRKEDGSIDWDNHIHSTQEEVDKEYQYENFEIRCSLCWGIVRH